APLRWLTDDWSLDVMLQARSGAPINVFQAQGQIVNSVLLSVIPDVVPGVPLWIDDSSAPGGRRLNPAAFQARTGTAQGDLGRNALRGFGFSQLDAGIHRTVRLAGTARAECRIEVFNVLNTASFADPQGLLTNPLFGRSTQMLNRSYGSGGLGGGL